MQIISDDVHIIKYNKEVICYENTWLHNHVCIHTRGLQMKLSRLMGPYSPGTKAIFMWSMPKYLRVVS